MTRLYSGPDHLVMVVLLNLNLQKSRTLPDYYEMGTLLFTTGISKRIESQYVTLDLFDSMTFCYHCGIFTMSFGIISCTYNVFPILQMFISVVLGLSELIHPICVTPDVSF